MVVPLPGLTLNGISLGDILIGESVPGLYLKMSHALVIDPSFTPNLRQSSHLYAPPYAHGPGNLDVRQKTRSEPKKGSSVEKDKFSPMKDSHSEEHAAPIFELWDKAPHDDTRLAGPVTVRESASHSTVGYEEIRTEPFSPLKSLNFWIIFTIVCVVLPSFAILVYLLFRCRRRNEGSYNVEENHTFIEQRALSLRKFANDNDSDAINTASASAPTSAKAVTSCIGDRYQRSNVNFPVSSPCTSDAIELRSPVGTDGSESCPNWKSDLVHSSPPTSFRLSTRGQPQSPNKEWYV
ncbi:unnamed protein product [Schistocephalus solidus]|uniref:Uncharacterized protein n=1 Tax=Schistocephalus solidus TaxID=70667 RepID=A0A183SUW9_SCHSO|nr:unnamed protein product [Schistocephalus solidus]